MLKYILTIFSLVLSISSFGQRYELDSGSVTFFSNAPLEDIKATTSEIQSFFDSSSGDIVYAIEMNTFQFKKSLMQEHFNDQYVESDKYPRSTFRGKVVNYQKGSDSSSAKVVGKMEIHGQKIDFEVVGELKHVKDAITMSAVFPVRLEDFKIKIPKLFWQNIAEEVEVTVDLTYKPL